MLVATVTLTNDQIKALPTTAIEIVAAPGANKVIFPIAAWLHLLNWAADYGNIGDASVLGVEYDGTANSPLSVLMESVNGEVSNLLVDSASHPGFLGIKNRVNTVLPTVVTPSGVGQFVDDPGTINKSLKLYAVNSGSATGNFNGGDAANTLKVLVYYVVVDLS